MKCFLLFLAFELVTSDKLDRTYLPPPGAQLSGGSFNDLQTPLEFPKESYLEQTQSYQRPGKQEFEIISKSQTQNNEISEFTPEVDYPTSTYPDNFIQSTLIPDNVRDITEPTSNPDLGIYVNSSPKLPSAAYLPTEKTISTQEFYATSTSSPMFEARSNVKQLMKPRNNSEISGYYYYVPQVQTNINNAANNKFSSDNIFKDGLNPYPNQENNLNLGSYRPKIGTFENISQNYQPSAFGFYGGNPMIMNTQIYSQKELDNMDQRPKFEENNSNNAYSMKINKIFVAHPFQTPLVGQNTQSAHIYNTSKSSSSQTSYLNQPKFPKTTITLKDKETAPVGLENRKNIPIPSKFKYRRPQSESDINAKILDYQNDVTAKEYSFNFDTSNGINFNERGTATDGIKKSGSYSYTGDDGKVYSITYTADENGFQPRGDHLPTPPPIPEAIKKVIEQAKKDKAAGIVNDGSYDEKMYGYMKYQGAMDRYVPFRKGTTVNVARKTGSKRPIFDAQTRPSIKTEINNGLNGGTKIGSYISLNNDKITTRKPLSQANSNVDTVNGEKYKDYNIINENLQNLQANNKGTIQDTKEYKQKTIINNDGQGIHQIEIPTSLFTQKNLNQNDNTNSLTTGKDQHAGIKPDSMKIAVSKYNNEEQLTYVTQSNKDSNKKLLSNVVTSYDNGYYYVPPLIKFEVEDHFKNTFKKLTPKNKDHITVITPKQNMSNQGVTRRIGFKNIENQKMYIDTNNNDSTRKPYVSGPQDQFRGNYYGDTQTQALNLDENKLNTDDYDTSSYVFTTTPMPTQDLLYGIQLDDTYPDQYQQTINIPGSYEQTVPQALENRENIPEISISQNFATSTYRPGIDGINLKVNQNVNIYGLGRPTASYATQDFPDKSSTIDGFYTTPSPKNYFKLTDSYPDEVFEGQQTYEDNPDFGGPIQFGKTENLGNSIFNPDKFGNSHLSPGQHLDTSTFPPEGQISTEKIIGEDFSGPKQPQGFEPKTGYYYK